MPKMPSLCLVALFALLATTTFAQSDDDETLFGQTGLRLSGGWGGFSTGAAIFSQETVPTFGSFGGVEFNRVLLIGLMGERTTGSVGLEDAPGVDFKLKHRGLLLGFTPNSHKVFHPRLSFAIGGGEVSLNTGQDDSVFVVQPAVGAEVNVFRWWKLGLEGGYRFVSGASATVLSNEEISAPFVNLRFRFGYSWGRSD